MKKICFVFNSLGIGGSQKIEAFVANACKRSGYDVSVICFTKSDVGVEIDPDIPIQYVLNERTKSIVSNIKKVLFLGKLRKEIQKENPDIICVFLADITRIVVLACKGLNIPIIGSERGAPGRHGKRLKRYNKAFTRCRKVVFQTEEARAYYNLPEHLVEIISNPCFPRWENNKVLSQTPKIICGAGRLCRQKRFDVLINAFFDVHKKHPEYRLRIYGSGPLENELKEQINNLGLIDSAQLCGYSKDVFSEVGIPEVFVLSSDYEGIPNVLMEAMSLGTACVATNCEPGGAKMLFADETRGLLSPLGDDLKLATNINRIIEDEVLANHLREKSKEINEEYAPSVIEAKWLQVFDKCIKR